LWSRKAFKSNYQQTRELLVLGMLEGSEVRNANSFGLRKEHFLFIGVIRYVSFEYLGKAKTEV